MKTFRVSIIAASIALAFAPHYAKADAGMCIASAPITVAPQWCGPGTGVLDSNGEPVKACGPTPEAAAAYYIGLFKQGWTLCGCQPDEPKQFNNPYICRYSVPDQPQLDCQFKLQVWPQCPKGSQSIFRGKCEWQSAIDEDKRVADAGGRINRDDNGNIVSIEQPVGVTVSQSGGYDAFGRFSWSDELNFKWDAQGGIYPIAIGFAGQDMHMRFTKDGQPNFSYLYNDNVLSIDWLSYWDNGSVQWHTTKNQYGTTSYQYNEDGTPVKPQTAPARIKTAAATVAAPTPQLGVHQITMQPGGSLYQVPVIAAGATLLYPPARDTLVRFMSDAWHACFPAASMDPSDVDKSATDKYFADRLACYQAVSAKYKDKPMDTPAAINAQAEDLMRCMASADQRRALRAAGTAEGALPPLVLP